MLAKLHEGCRSLVLNSAKLFNNIYNYSIGMRIKLLSKKEKELLRGIRHSSNPGLFLYNFYDADMRKDMERIEDYQALAIYLNDSERKKVYQFYQNLHEQETRPAWKKIYQGYHECIHKFNKDAERLQEFFQQFRAAKQKMDEEMMQPPQLQQVQELKRTQQQIPKKQGFLHF